MTSAEEIPDAHTIVRYTGRDGLDDDGYPSRSQFLVQVTTGSGPERNYPSVNWLERLSDDGKEAQLEGVRRVLRLKRGKEAMFCEFNVGTIRARTRKYAPNLDVVNYPLEATETQPEDPSHSETRGLPDPDSRVARVVADIIAHSMVAVHRAVI